LFFRVEDNRNGNDMKSSAVQLSATGDTEAAEQEADGFLTTSKMAARLHVTPPTLIKWAKGHGKIPFIQLDRKILWHVQSVTQALLRLQRLKGSGAL
jgi:hypothetical protein